MDGEAQGIRDEIDLAALRQEYARGGLDLPDLVPDPLAVLRGWMADVVAAGLHEPNTMVLSTVSPAGQVSSRMVLLKNVDSGLVFYTNQSSRKADDLAVDPRCALLFPWHAMERQVRVEGVAEKVSDLEADTYFATRPRGAQLGAWASDQSQQVWSRSELAESYARTQERFGDEVVPRPPHWGGYRVVPTSVEFWQGRPERMHDRLRYDRDLDGVAPDGWTVRRLAP